MVRHMIRFMLITDAGASDACWQYAERYVGGGTRTYSRHAGEADVSAACHPQHGSRSFELPTFWVPLDRATLLTNTIASRLPVRYRDGERLLLPVHPDALTHEGLVGREQLPACEPGPRLEVVPLANVRTVFVVASDGAPVPPHLLKLHYPRRLSRFHRRLRRAQIEVQLWVADELARLDVPFLAEVSGTVFGSGEDAWGFVVREPPALSRSEPMLVVPLFALYGRDIRSPGDATLLEQLVAAAGGRAEEFIAERIVAPMVRLWTRAALEAGCALEMHGQNTLLAFTPDGRHTEVFYRDCDVCIDPATRRRLGLERTLPRTNIISRDVPIPAPQIFSLGYDSFMGHHTLDYLARLAGERLAVDPRALHAAARQTFAGAVGDMAEELLPPTVYYYDEGARREGVSWRLADTGRRPQWR
jgi:ferric iron reductase FhuF-like transporter